MISAILTATKTASLTFSASLRHWGLNILVRIRVSIGLWQEAQHSRFY